MKTQMKEVGRPLLKKKSNAENNNTKEDKKVKKKDTESKDGKENKDVKKDKESKKNEKEVKNKANSNSSRREKLKTVNILADCMIKKLNGYFLPKKVRHKYLIKVHSQAQRFVVWLIT